MFESLTDRLSLTFKKWKGQGKLTEANMKEGLREVRLALLEADVHYKIAKDFIDRLKERHPHSGKVCPDDAQSLSPRRRGMPS
jgi:signal recognition particle subunit SRP54